VGNERDDPAPPVWAGSASRQPGATPGAGGAMFPPGQRVARVLRGLVGLPQVLRLYPPGHNRVAAQLAEVERLLADAFRAYPDGLALSVHGTKLRANGHDLEGADELSADLALRMRRRRIGSFLMLPAIDRDELRLLAELLGADERDLLKDGELDAFLTSRPHPNLVVGTFVSDGGPEKSEACRKFGVAHDETALLAGLCTPGIRERIEGLRSRLLSPGPGDAPVYQEGVCDLERVLDGILEGFLQRPDWSELEGEAVERALDSFLDLVEHSIQTVGRDRSLVQSRIESLDAFFGDLKPADLATRKEIEVRTGDLAYSNEKVRYLLDNGASDLRSAIDGIRVELEQHHHEENALLILCDLMYRARTVNQYAERRRMFLVSLGDRRYGSASVARTLRYMARELPPVAWEARDNLIQAVIDATADFEALTLFLVSMTDRPDAARPILTRLAQRPDPFPLLVRLITTPLLDPFRHILHDKLIDAAKTNRQALDRWARRNPAHFFRREVFDPLLHTGTELLGPICKEILKKGGLTERAVLIERLTEDGTETALRLLVLGMAYGHEDCNRDLLTALAQFEHPLAVAALRDVVHRSNTRELRAGDASAALMALRELDTDESRAFLREVAHARAGLLHKFRKELRRIAEHVLAEGTAAS